MHQEIVILRQTLKTAVRHGWLERLPESYPEQPLRGQITKTSLR